ncbi:MAG: cupredoxin domain-containing protein [Myxococcales bacterium]|nr:cupredoxin domain-containing protein [Myxococcales bacterium]
MRTTFIILAVLAVTACKKDEAKPAVVTPPPPVAAPVVEALRAVEAPTPAAAGTRSIEMKVTDDGFQPGNVTLKKGEPVKFIVTRVTDATCATELLIADTDIKAELPLNKPVEIAWTPTKAGQVKFGCAMDMMVGGMLLVE